MIISLIKSISCLVTRFFLMFQSKITFKQVSMPLCLTRSPFQLSIKVVGHNVVRLSYISRSLEMLSSIPQTVYHGKCFLFKHRIIPLCGTRFLTLRCDGLSILHEDITQCIIKCIGISFHRLGHTHSPKSWPFPQGSFQNTVVDTQPSILFFL